MTRFLAFCLYLSTAFLMVTPAYLLLGVIERAYFPVVGKLQIVRSIGEKNSTLVYVSFDKKRDCEYLGITWSKVLPDGTLQRVPIELKPEGLPDNSDSTRPVGKQVAGPWRIAMPADEVIAKSVVTLRHRCHPLYDTLTRVYP